LSNNKCCTKKTGACEGGAINIMLLFMLH